jgi:hypothetical protein
MVEYLADRDIPRALNAPQRAAPHLRKAIPTSGDCRKAPVVKPSYTGAPDTIRTCGLRLRRATLYPAELRAQCLAVQRPNESNPLGVCCDIVKPVFSALSYDDIAPRDTITSLGDLFEPPFEPRWSFLKMPLVAAVGRRFEHKHERRVRRGVNKRSKLTLHG